MVKEKHSFILLNKLQAPQVKIKTLFRERLINLLSENLDKKLILLCAGAGYGKTTLLSQFISGKKLSYVYYHLENSDAEPAVFFSYLIAGIRRINPEFGKKTEHLSHFFNASQRYLDVIIGTFTNEIIENIKEDLYIILEDYHTLYPSEQMDRILVYLLDHLPTHVHLIVTSRVALPVSMPQLRARNEIFELGNQQLRFTKEEVKALFVTVYSSTLKESELEWIVEHSEGWPTSLRLILQSTDYREGTEASGFIRKIFKYYRQSQSHIFNYFAQEIFNQESRGMRQFLIDCSVLEWLTPELCDAVTRRKKTGDILDDLTERNAFLVRIPGMGYRFHTLFKDFLRSKITDKNRARRIFRRAGDFYSQDGRLEEAVKFYLQAQEYDKASTIIENIGPSLIAQGKSGILCLYIESIPKSTHLKHPSLLMNYAHSLKYVGRPDEAKYNCLRAVRILKTKSRARKKYADALYTLGGMYLNLGKFTTAKRWFQKALSVCPKSSRLTKASILNSIGSIYTAIGGRDLHVGTEYFRKALRIAQRNGYKSLEASILNNWGMNEFRAGNLNQAYSKLLKIVNYLKEYFSLGCGAGFYNASRFGLRLGHIKEALSILDQGVRTCRVYNDLWSMATLWYGYALVYQELGDTKRAQQYILKALRVYEKLGIVQRIIPTLNQMCQINIKTGELMEAERNLSKAWVLKGNRNDIDAVPLFLTEAKLKSVQGKFTDAEDILRNALKLSQNFRLIFNTFLLTIELSKVLYLQGETEKALLALDKAVMISRSKGYDYLLLRELQHEKWMVQYIKYAKRDHKNAQYVISIIKKSPLNIHWLEVFLFGVPRVIIDDYEIQDDAWKTVKSKELFFYLLLHKDEKSTRDSLIDILWHDASPKSGSDNLRKTLQYVRETLRTGVPSGDGLITSGRGLYHISFQSSIWLDVDEFEHFVNKAKGLKEQDKTFRGCLQKAESLYKGGFAEGWYDPWVEERRHYYQNLYEECLSMTADFYFGKKKFKEAIIWFRKLTALNYCVEEYHRKLMRAYAKLGRHEEIVKDFEKLRGCLKKELDSEPQSETIKLFKSLVKSFH